MFGAGAVRECSTASGTTDTEISQHAVSLACDRGEGRKERSKRAAVKIVRL